MPLDVVVLDDDMNYMKHLHIGPDIQGILFKKYITTDEYPSLGLARDDAEDITFLPEHVPTLMEDLDRLKGRLVKETRMSDEVKGRALKFVDEMLEVCRLAKAEGRRVEFVAGD